MIYPYAAVAVAEPPPPSPSRRPGEEFFAWLDRMHAEPPTVHVGEVYMQGDDACEVIGVTSNTVRWRERVEGARVQSSYRVTFEEWAATATRVACAGPCVTVRAGDVLTHGRVVVQVVDVVDDTVRWRQQTPDARGWLPPERCSREAFEEWESDPGIRRPPPPK